jgi:dipeptide transport system ATP-binding protein
MSLLEVKDLKMHYPIKSFLGETRVVKALDGISFKVSAQKTLGIVGESGCGKSTLAKTLMGIEPPTSGSISFKGKSSQSISTKELFQTIQMIFQDPYSSLNPRKKAWRLIAEPLLINSSCSKEECFDKACELMEKVGLRPEMANRYPHMFSGGQRQRLGIARALILNPEILICDEPVSALDVSIQAQVLNLLVELQDSLKLTYLFISHDLNVVEHIADEIMVMYLGKIVEYGPRDQIFNNPQHPYTLALLKSSPNVFEENDQHEPLKGEPPSPINPPSGCSFHERCPQATERCQRETPLLSDHKERAVACFNL